MPNQAYALEWLNLAKKNLETARLLIREKHYTDSIALEVHQTIEKSFKAVYAYHGVAIPRTHSLTILFNFVCEKIQIDKSNIDDIIVISDYYETDRYPGPRYIVPIREEVEANFKYTEELYHNILEALTS
jgi:HEPN domain-containing protein